MESEKELDGKQGSEILKFSPIENIYMTPAEYEDRLAELEKYQPRGWKKSIKLLRETVKDHLHTWTWRFGSLGSSYRGAYKTDDKYTEVTK